MTAGRRHLSIVALAFASASSSAAPLETLPVLFGKELPETASPAPTDAEWANARTVRPHRGAPGTCSYRSVREWLEIRCMGLAGVGLVAGDPQGVVVRVTGRMEDPAETRIARAVVPIRRGEAKVLGFLETREEYSGSSFGEAGTLSVVWRAARPDPVLVSSGFVPEERAPAR